MKNKLLLSICIPTYNRADRLNKSLNDLLVQIIKSESKQYLSVFVSNNGSIDTTNEVINKYRDIFNQNNISFSDHNSIENYGFDANVLECYRKCDSEYIWFLSDDDNIIDGAINSIIDDIKVHSPNVLYYNFDQDPHNLENPYIKESKLYDNVDIKNISSILEIINCPKLTSLVIKKMDGGSGEKAKVYNYNYMHIALAIQTGLDYGKIFHSDKFIASTDDDYLDNIDFVPFIQNDLIKTVYLMLNENNKLQIYQQMKLKTVDPLTSSMNHLACYYRGKYALTPELKSKLYSTVVNELKHIKLTEIKLITLIISTIKFLISFVYNIGHMVLTGKSASRLRSIK